MMMFDNLPVPEGYHYRGMTPISSDSKLCYFIPVEKAGYDWKDRYSHLWTYNPEKNIKDQNGKIVPLIHCTVCDKNLKVSFQTNGKLSFTNFMKHIKDSHITELSANDQQMKLQKEV